MIRETGVTKSAEDIVREARANLAAQADEERRAAAALRARIAAVLESQPGVRVTGKQVLRALGGNGWHVAGAMQSGWQLGMPKLRTVQRHLKFIRAEEKRHVGEVALEDEDELTAGR